MEKAEQTEYDAVIAVVGGVVSSAVIVDRRVKREILSLRTRISRKK